MTNSDDAYDGRWNETIEIRRFVYILSIFNVKEKKKIEDSETT